MADMREEIGATPHAAKKSKFNVGDGAAVTERKRNYIEAMKAAHAKKTKLLPPAADIEKAFTKAAAAPAESNLKQPPHNLTRELVTPPLIIAIDIETHDWEDNEVKAPRRGQFAWTLQPESTMAYQRAIEIAWLVAPPDQPSLPEPKSRLVKPDGFEISLKATTRCHQITNAEAAAEGVPLASALKEFMKDVVDAFSRGGRIVSHHLQFDAEIISHELQRAGLQSLRDTWETIAAQGFCTMQPEVSKWAVDSYGAPWKNQVITLGTLAKYILPKDHKVLSLNQHRAGPDSLITYVAYCMMLKAVKYHASRRDVHMSAG